MAAAATASVRDFAHRATSLDPETMAQSILDAIDKAAASRWGAAVERAATLPGELRPEKVRALTDQLSRELAAIGAAAGVAAVAPTVGTTATLMASTAELAWFTTRCGDLILTIAALHGRGTPTVDERRAWVLAVLIYGGTAREGFVTVADGLGVGLGAGATHLPIATLRAVNGVLGRKLMSRYGKRRGVIALGRALPLGIGAVIGGGANWTAVRALAKQADQFFARMPYSAIDTTAIDIGGALPAPRPAT